MIFDVGFSIHDAKILIDVESDAENVLNVSENNNPSARTALRFDAKRV
jgi:hypothetical protein